MGLLNMMQKAGSPLPPPLTPEQRAERDRAAKETQRKQTQFIHDARALMSPSPVKYNDLPNWVRLRLLKLVKGKRGQYAVCTKWAVLDDARRLFGWEWLDHHGTTTFRGRPAFVSEPYHLTRKDVDNIDDLCKAIGCEWFIDANSYHYPGYTIRVLIHEPTPTAKPEMPSK